MGPQGFAKGLQQTSLINGLDRTEIHEDPILLDPDQHRRTPASEAGF